MSKYNSTFRVAVLSVIFAVVVALSVVYYQSFFIPVFIGAISAFKGLFKALTPKLFLLLAKNTLLIKVRQWLTQVSTEFFVLSHRPLRPKIRVLKNQLFKWVSGLFQAYTQSSLWFRTAVAIGLLIFTASSSYVFFALMIIPQAILSWIKLKLIGVLQKLGVTSAVNTLWAYLVPGTWRSRWRIYRKWSLGRRQIRSARLMHEKVAKNPLGAFRASVTSDTPDQQAG